MRGSEQGSTPSQHEQSAVPLRTRVRAFGKRHTTLLSALPLIGGAAYSFAEGDLFVGVPLASFAIGMINNDLITTGEKKREKIVYHTISAQLGSKETPVFSALPSNEGAALLHDTLGITYPEPYGEPRVIVFEGKNEADYKKEYRSLLTRRRVEDMPIYNPLHHAIFTDKEPRLQDMDELDLRKLLQANMRAYVFVSNSDIGNLMRQRLSLDTIIGSHMDIPDFDLSQFPAERYVVYRCFMEGLVAQMTFMAYDRTMEEAARTGEEWRAFEGDTEVEIADFEAIEGYQPLVQHIKDLDAVLKGKKHYIRRGMKARELIAEESTFIHIVGGDFAVNAYAEMEDMGIDKRSIIDMLVANPPTTVPDIMNAKKFVLRTFGKNRGRR